MELKVNNKQKRLGKIISKRVSKLLNKKVDVGYEFYQNNKAKFLFDIWENDYDYKTITLKYLEKNDIKQYVSDVLHCITAKKYDVYVANIEERYIKDILKEIGVKNLYITENTLFGSGYEIYLEDIDILNYNKIDGILYLESDGEKFYVDLENETIRYIN